MHLGRNDQSLHGAGCQRTKTHDDAPLSNICGAGYCGVYPPEPGQWLYLASRTNRVLNDTKPYGNVLEFRGQDSAVDEAIALCSGEDEDAERSKEIWLVDAAPKVIDQLKKAVSTLNTFMQSQGLDCAPEQVANLKGDEARAQFVNSFKEVQRLKTQLDQYTDLTSEESSKIEQVIPEDQLLAFRGVYLDTAQKLKARQDKGGDDSDPVQQLDFEFVLFASAVIDYDYIMGLISRYIQGTPQKQKMTREQLIGLLSSTANFMDERAEMIAYIDTLTVGEGLSEKAIRDGYESFKAEKFTGQLTQTAQKHGLESQALETFVGGIMDRMIFDGEQLSALLAPQDLGWKERTKKELALMDDLMSLLKKLAQGREISGLAAYE